MMDEIASHILDIVANSVAAKATRIIVEVLKDETKNTLSLRIKDNGIGMDEETAQKVLDPFYTTKIGKKVGLGIPLLKGTAETTGGTFKLSSAVGEGTEISVSLDLDHPDVPPLGNLRDTILVLIVSNPATDFLFRVTTDSREFVVDTREMRELLDGVPVSHPDVIEFLTKYIDENM